MATSAEITAAAQAAKDAITTYYDQAKQVVQDEASFWRDSVDSPLTAVSEAATSSAVEDATATLEALGLRVS